MGASPCPVAASGCPESSATSALRPPPQPLDYERRDQYDLTVAVQNEAPLQAAAPRAQRGQARVHVQVQDVNEAPVFQENPLRTSLPEGTLPGTPVATFSAQDPDTQQLQRLRWGPRGEAEGAQGPLVHCPARARSTADPAQRAEGSSVCVRS